jgi:predicted nucleic acid-binding protein
MSRIVVVDANIVFRTLCAGSGRIRNALSPAADFELVSPRFLFVELFKHKDRLLSASKLCEEDLLDGLYAIVSRINFVNESEIPLGTWTEAFRLCRGIDERDTAYVALALHLRGSLWTKDQELRRGLESRGFTRFFAE